MKIDLEWLEEYKGFVRSNWKYLALGLFFIFAAFFGEKSIANTRDFPIVDTAANAAQMSVLLESNGTTQTVKFQCNDISECAERLAERINNKGTCNPQVNKILIEKIYIPGM